RIVDTLTAADRFAVLTFDHEVESPTGLPDDALATATDRHRFRAVQHLASVEARGGTEMVEPLQRAAALLAGDAAERDRVLILVTDGQVGNEDALLSALGPRLTRLRVHTVGIDSAVNAGFLRRLAGAGGGHCELVESEDRLDAAMDAIHRRIGTALVTGLRLGAIGGLAEVDQNSVTPARLPDLFAGAPLVIAGRLGEGVASVRARTRSGEPGIVITGQASDGSAWRRRVAAVETTDADLAQFWARGRIRDLEDEYLSTYQGQADIERAIVATSVGYGVLSCFTAFVAVDTRVVNEGGVTKRVTQPVDLPHGWADEAPVFLEAAIAAAAPSAPPKPAPMYRTRSARAFPAPAAPGAAPTPSAEPFRDLSRAADKEKKVATPTGQPDTTITHAFATIWLTRLTAAANATAEAQEALLTEFTAALRTLSPHSTPDAARYQELLDTLEATDNPAADRLQSAIKYLESLDKPRRRPFWKR
ncbi:MAG TPA: VWA domain-containing protein, partial [Streptomyces sp.]